eukprot:jgi/Psemu1/292209/fgenesh1_pg.956_\
MAVMQRSLENDFGLEYRTTYDTRPKPNPRPKPSSLSKSLSNKPKNPLRVLGIALIVDQKGTGARMLARYPTSQSSVKKMDDEDDEDPDEDRGNGNTHAHTHAHTRTDFDIESDAGDDTDDDDDDDDDEGRGDDRKRSSKRDDDLFFTLTARQMAKLFRTKRSLCNQPMTLRVNKTVFCCHAVLLNEHEGTGGGGGNGNGSGNGSGNGGSKPGRVHTREKAPAHDTESDRESKHEHEHIHIHKHVHESNETESNETDQPEDNELKLFSVVVALSASKHQQTALPFSSFWDAGGGDDMVDLERYIQHGAATTATKPKQNETDPATKPRDGKPKDPGSDKRWKQQKKREQTAARVSSIFLAIRRVHISLVRFCRALEREEHRCGYVTQQSFALFRTRTERQKQWEARSTSLKGGNASAASGNSGGGGDRGSFPRGQSHSRTNSFLSVHTVVGGETSESVPVVDTVEKEQEKEQEILELMLACNPQQDQSQQSWYDSEPYRSQQGQHGNLVRDLVAVFHSLSRNDQEYPPTPSSLLCERDAVVYVNNHFAIPIDAAGLNGTMHHSSSPAFGSALQNNQSMLHHIAQNGPIVLPYYTLLFPHASPSEMLQTFRASGSAPPQQLEHLLLTVNPQKPLAQIAIDANLPMHTTMQIASFLVGHGACITSPVVTSRSRLTCLGSDSMQRIRELALEFSQAFPGVNLFGVVSYLTTCSRHLGDAMAVLVDTDNDEGAWLREALLASPKYRFYNRNRLHGGTDGDSGGAANDAAAANLIQESIRNGTHQALFRDEKESYVHSPTLRPKASTPDPLYAPPPISVHEWLKDLEDLLYAIAVWLLSRGVLVQLQEYMVAVEAPEPAPSSSRVVQAMDLDESNSSLILPPIGADHPCSARIRSGSGASIPISTSSSSKNDVDEDLFKELMDMGYLNGDISIMALSWRLAIDSRKLRHWGLRQKRVRVISRVPSSGDDWEPTATTATATTPSPAAPPAEFSAAAVAAAVPVPPL